MSDKDPRDTELETGNDDSEEIRPEPETPPAPPAADPDPDPAARRQELRLKMTSRPLGVSGRIARAFLDSKLTLLVVVFSMLLGGLALLMTPSEEEPQINVPMIDVMLGYPGASAEEVEQQLVTPLEKLLYEIANVEYIYSTSQPSGGLIIVRFLVGTDPDQAALRVHTKIASAIDQMPEGAMPPVVKPRTIDDVPVAAYTLWGEGVTTSDLRAVADELQVELTRHPRVAQTWVIGGQRRVVRVDLDRDRLAAFNTSVLQCYQALRLFNWRLPAGTATVGNAEIVVDVGTFLGDAREVADVVVGIYGERPVYLKDVAEVVDGPEEPASYVWLGSGLASEKKDLKRGLDLPAVTLAVAKKPGTNAIDMVSDLDRMLANLQGKVIPSNVEILKTRDYGLTAKQKSNELLHHLFSATLGVILLMGLTMSWREATVVTVAIPVTLALTLAASFFFGYTLNRITLFALIFSIGILVDDAIVVVENIHRHLKLRWAEPRLATVYAVDEVGNPTILATFAIVSALLPLAFVSGLMGPYMRPIPINASAAMLFSVLVAFVISPWLALRLFQRRFANAGESESAADDEAGSEDTFLARTYSRIMRPMIRSSLKRYLFLAAVAGLLVISISSVLVGFTTVKMLPHDNKSELQIMVDAPEGFSLEQTNAAAREIANVFRSSNEVIDFEVYVGTSAPFNFNGLVRHYFMRSAANQADIQINFVGAKLRDLQSHDLAKQVREQIVPIAERLGVKVKVAEIPPGPPVMSTLVAEVYGPTLAGRVAVAEQVREIFATTDGVVDVDWEVEDQAPRVEIRLDRDKAARSGISPEQVARTLRVALHGEAAGLAHLASSRSPVPILLRLERGQRSHIEDLLQLSVHGSDGRMVPLSEVAHAVTVTRERARYHKNLQPVSYVYGEVAGVLEAPVYGILEMSERLASIVTPDGENLGIIATHLPEDTTRYMMKWDGEWHITYEVFRDMGIAFAVVMVLIYVLMVGWFKSFVTPIVIMVPIPLTLIGILPAHGIFGVFFTATSMIGFIALSGIIVRNSILLVDFINLELGSGEPLEHAVVKAGAVRLLPIVLTQASTIVGGSFMLTDPIFQGLALALIAGITISTFLTLGVIPVLYYMYLKTVGVSSLVKVGNPEVPVGGVGTGL